jgi:hypothetical protein
MIMNSECRVENDPNKADREVIDSILFPSNA